MLVSLLRAFVNLWIKPNGQGKIDGEKLNVALIAMLDNIENRAAWSPVLALVNDGSRRCIQIVDWVGSVINLNPKPDTGYIGASGIVATLAAAADFSAPGPKGDPGTLTASAFTDTSVFASKKVVLQNGTTMERIDVSKFVTQDGSGGLQITAGFYNSIFATNADGSYPDTINALGTGKLSLGANQVIGLSDLAFINSNLLSSAMSFWSMPTATSKKLLLMLRNGRVGIGEIDPSSALHVKGANGYNQFRLETAYTPTGSADPNGAVGDICRDANYIYKKEASGWTRSPIFTTF